MAKGLRLTLAQHEELYHYCHEVGISYLSTPFDLESIAFLIKLKLPVWKIASGEITNLPCLIKIAETHKPVIMSTGMSNMDEIGGFCERYSDGYLRDKITLIHTQLSFDLQDVNLNAISYLKDFTPFNIAFGKPCFIFS